MMYYGTGMSGWGMALMGLSGLLFELYTPEAYFNQGFRSVELRETRPS